MDAMMLLRQAQQQEKPEKKYDLLKKAHALAPDSLPVLQEMLLTGDYDRWPRGDLRRIGCYLFHGFEHPEQHPEEEQQRMALEFFHSSLLDQCLALADDPQAFLKEYFTALGANYISIFIREDRAHMPYLFGYLATRKIPRYLAAPMGSVIRNIFLCPFLTGEQQSLLAGCFYRACYQYLEGQTGPLDENLGASICALIR